MYNIKFPYVNVNKCMSAIIIGSSCDPWCCMLILNFQLNFESIEHEEKCVLRRVNNTRAHERTYAHAHHMSVPKLSDVS